MKKLLCASFASALVIVSGGLQAAEDSGFYAGIGAGRLDFDFDDATFRTSTGALVSGQSLNLDVDSGNAIRLSAGYNWGGFAFELGYEHMIDSVDIDSGGTSFNNFDYSNVTLGGVYRSSGTLYVIGKAGLSMPHIEANRTNTRLKMDDVAYYGGGVGYRFTPVVSLEFDYTRTTDDTGSFMLNLRRHF